MQIGNPREFITHLISIFSLRCLTLSIAAVVATLISLRMGWIADYPMALIGTAVIFPIVFAINSAYQRREEALHHYAQIKANLRSIYFSMAHWRGSLSEDELEKTIKIVSAPMFAIRELITNDHDDLRKNERGVYQAFSELSKVLENHGDKNKFTGAQVSTAHRFLNVLMIEFESLKHIYQYRTPRALQAFSDVFITVLPILYGPVFAKIATDIDNKILAFLVPALFAFVLSSLDNIQADLEDPFDGIGVDDMVINAEIFEGSLAG